MAHVIKTPDTYQCQICGEIYEQMWQAELCERQPIKEPKHNLLGAEVKVQTRHEGLLSVHIVGFGVIAAYARTIKDSETLDTHLQKFFERHSEHHTEIFLISETLEMGKSDFRNWVFDSEIVYGSTI